MIGTWNVRTLSDTSKPAQVARDMDKLQIRLAETRWVESGDEELQSGLYFMFSGNKSERAKGLEIMISSKCRECLKGFNPNSERLIIAGF